ncbi:MAG: DUF503 domain-containing protein [Deltaproteobacteria bacterium]|nr:DUF503 domain-containing protein [Deltaproteobacteria bacterium]
MVGVLRLQLMLPGTASLKEKRAILRRLLDRVRGRFHIAAAEVGEHDLHQSAVIGFSTVGADGAKVARVLERVTKFIEGTGLVEVAAVEEEVVRYDELEETPTSLAEKYGLPELEERIQEEERAAGRAAFRPGSLGLGSNKISEEGG